MKLLLPLLLLIAGSFPAVTAQTTSLPASQADPFIREHNEREAKKRGVLYEVGRMEFGSIARAIETDETAGVLKLILDPESERILGANVVGVEAGELIHVFAALMQAGATARALVDVEIAHPTFAEGLQSVAMQLPRYALR